MVAASEKHIRISKTTYERASQAWTGWAGSTHSQSHFGRAFK